MEYLEFSGPIDLSSFVECFWRLKPIIDDDRERDIPVFPDGSTDILCQDGEWALRGPVNSVGLIAASSTIIGVRIRAGAAKALLRTSPSELVDAILPLESFGVTTAQYGDESDLSSTASLISIVRHLAAKGGRYAQPDGRIQAIADQLGYIGSPGLATIAARVGWTERHMRRCFRDHVGMGVKEFGRIMRFQHVLDAIRACQRTDRRVVPNWAAIATDYGFADQSHLIREVTCFAGMPPGALWQTF